MPQLKFEHRVLLALIGFGLTAVIITVAVIWPTARSIRQLKKDTDGLLLYMEKKYEGTRHLRSSQAKAHEIKEEVLSATKHLYYAGDELKLITLLENAASQHNLTYKIENSNLDQKPTQPRAKLVILVSGQYRDALNFLVELANMDYFLNADKTQFYPAFERREENANGANLRLNLSLYVSR